MYLCCSTEQQVRLSPFYPWLPKVMGERVGRMPLRCALPDAWYLTPDGRASRLWNVCCGPNDSLCGLANKHCTKYPKSWVPVLFLRLLYFRNRLQNEDTWCCTVYVVHCCPREMSSDVNIACCTSSCNVRQLADTLWRWPYMTAWPQLQNNKNGVDALCWSQFLKEVISFWETVHCKIKLP